jgi:hypothetical protein
VCTIDADESMYVGSSAMTLPHGGDALTRRIVRRHVRLFGNEHVRDQDCSASCTATYLAWPEVGSQTVRRQGKDCPAVVARLASGDLRRRAGEMDLGRTNMWNRG